jgi:hypothetical protein
VRQTFEALLDSILATLVQRGELETP